MENIFEICKKLHIFLLNLFLPKLNNSYLDPGVVASTSWDHPSGDSGSQLRKPSALNGELNRHKRPLPPAKRVRSPLVSVLKFKELNLE